MPSLQKSKRLFLRVQSGLLKGHILQMAEHQTTRSSKSILKQSLFNTLSPILNQYCFIEVFAGTGSIGIEAISRGAKAAYFIEKDPSSYRVLQENLQSIQSRIKEIKIQSFKGDSFSILPEILSQARKEEKFILFFDPPFPIRENFADIYEKCFALIEKLSANCLIVFEYFSSYQAPQSIKDFSIIKHKRFGKSSLLYYANHAKGE